MLPDFCIFDLVPHWHHTVGFLPTQRTAPSQFWRILLLRFLLRVFNLWKIWNSLNVKVARGSSLFSLHRQVKRSSDGKSHLKLCEGWAVTHSGVCQAEARGLCECCSCAGAEVDPWRHSLRWRAHYHFSRYAGAAEFEEQPGSEPPHSF